jgi:Leucine Rich repeat
LLRLAAVGDNAAMQTEPTKADPPKYNRRWFQFSLRTLLIFTTIVAIPCAWLANKMDKKRRDRDAVEAFIKLGARVHYDYEVANAGPTPPPGADWLRKFLGENFFSEVDSVLWGESNWSPPAKHGNLTDAELEHVGKLTELHRLMLLGDDVNVTDAGLVNLKGLTRLQELHLAAPNVTDAGLENLQGLTQLETLVVMNARVTDAGLKNLQRLTKLQSLSLDGTNVTDAGLVHLKGLTKLQRLYLYNTNVTDAGLVHLKGLTKLQYVGLSNTKVIGVGLANLKGLSQLRAVELMGNKVSDAAVKDFQQALPNCKIDR